MNRKLPPFAAIRAFEAAARLGSMQSASEELYLTPSAISHQVKALEVFIGAALFERKPGRLTLTPVGTTYQNDLRESLNLIEAATERASRRGETDHITVHMFNSLAELWFVPMLKDFHDEYPDMQISVICEPVAADFASGIADISVVYDRIRDDGEDWLLFIDEITPCCSEQFLKDHGPFEALESILDLPLIWCESDPDEWLTWFEHAGLGDVEPDRWISFDQRASALQAAREGLGFAMGRRPYLELDRYRTQLLQPFELVALTGCAYYIDVPQRTEHLAKIKIFKNWLIRVSRSEFPSAATTLVDAQPL